MADDPKKPEDVAEEIEAQPQLDADASEAVADTQSSPTAATGTGEPTAEEAKPKRSRAENDEEPKAEEAKPKRTRARKAEAADKPAEAEPPKAATEEPKAPKKEAAELRRKSGAAKDRQPGLVVKAQARYVRSSARKARLVCDQIRGKTVPEARALLAYNPRGAAEAWTKLLESAVANAENNHDLDGDDLRVVAVYADEGPTIKRYRPRAMGRATRIRKRTSHLSIQLTAKETI
jgi:ribosomal protein L22